MKTQKFPAVVVAVCFACTALAMAPLADGQTSIRSDIPKLPEASPEVLHLTHAEYVDRVTAIWLGQMLGQATGVRFEHQKASVLPETPPSKLPGYSPIDDDFYYEMVAVRGFERYGIGMTVQQLGQQWLKNDAGSWGSSHEALLLLRRGIQPPLTGNPRYNRLWWTIGPEFSSDLYGALSPGMPNQAAELARRFGHINGYAEGVDGAVFIAGMISIAFADHNPHDVVREAAQLIAPASPYRQALDTVISAADAHATPQEIFAAIVHRWGIEYPGTNNAVMNGAIVATSVWFGQGDYDKTLQLAVHAADYADTDCNAANAESVVAAMQGTRGLPADQVAALHDRVEGRTLGPETLHPPVDESISELGRRTAAIGEAMLVHDGINEQHSAWNIPVQPPKTLPAELFRLSDLMRFWNPAWKLIDAGFGGGDGGVRGIAGMTYLDGATLATYPYDVVRGVQIRRTVRLGDTPSLDLEVGVDPGRAWRLQIYCQDELLLDHMIEQPDSAHAEVVYAGVNGAPVWQPIHVNLSTYKNQTVTIRLYQNVLEMTDRPGDAYWRDLALHR